jgi:leucyl-tRNA synthetase
VLIAGNATEAERSAAALACPEARQHLDGKEVVKVVVPPGGKLVSIVVRG